MSGRKALITKDDLERMASAVAVHGVVFRGRVDPAGGFTFTLAPQADAGLPSRSDLDARLDEWGAL
jgi:hypothetical protein